MRQIATWNPARDAWETEQPSLICGHSRVYSATWPTSGMTRGGQAYELPMSAPLTVDSASSSSRGLPTPTATQYGSNQSPSPGAAVRPSLHGITKSLPTPSVANGTGGHATRSGSRSGELLLPGVAKKLAKGRPLPTPRVTDANGPGAHGEGGLDLRTAVTLLPTPRATDGTKGGPNQRGSSGDMMLPSAVMRMLPTPMATDADAASPAVVRSNLGAKPNPRHGGSTPTA